MLILTQGSLILVSVIIYQYLSNLIMSLRMFLGITISTWRRFTKSFTGLRELDITQEADVQLTGKRHRLQEGKPEAVCSVLTWAFSIFQTSVIGGCDPKSLLEGFDRSTYIGLSLCSVLTWAYIFFQIGLIGDVQYLPGYTVSFRSV